MARKDFKSGIDGLIQQSYSSENKTNKDDEIKGSNYIKATYYFSENQLKKIKAIAFYERKTIGKVIEEAFDIYMKAYPSIEEAEKLFSEKPT